MHTQLSYNNLNAIVKPFSLTAMEMNEICVNWNKSDTAIDMDFQKQNNKNQRVFYTF